MPCVVLWRPDALDCRVLIPPGASKHHAHVVQWPQEPRTSVDSSGAAIYEYPDVCVLWQVGKKRRDVPHARTGLLLKS